MTLHVLKFEYVIQNLQRKYNFQFCDIKEIFLFTMFLNLLNFRQASGLQRR